MASAKDAPFLVGSKAIGRLAAATNESVATGVSSFAKEQLAKFGWKE